MVDETKKDEVEGEAEAKAEVEPAAEVAVKAEETEPAAKAEEPAHAHEDAHDHEDEDEDEDGDGDEQEPLVAVKKRPALLLAQFESTADVLHAAEKVRDAGYTVWDTHSPFPIHGMDRAMGLKDSFLGMIVFLGGATGITTAVTMIWWMNGVDYPIVVGGKPPFALPSSVPVMFELMVLFSALTAVFAMFGINKLPRHHHPLFESDRFREASNDKFFISVEAEDPKFHVERTKSFLEGLHPSAVELVEEEIEEETPVEEHH